MKLAITALSVLILTCQLAFAERIILNQACDNNSQLVLEAVELTDEYSILHFIYNRKGSCSHHIGLYPAGHPKAFVAKSADGAQTFSLVKFTGIAQRPEGKGCTDGSQLKFQVYMESITASRFSLSEGDFSLKTKKRLWRFASIDLNSKESDSP